MKIILTSSVIAMISAGLYGTIDLSRDLATGNYVQYDREDIPSVTHLSAANNKTNEVQRMKRGNDKVLTKDEIANATSTVDLSDLNIKDFSRGEPLVLDEPLATDSTTASSAPVVAVDIQPLNIQADKPEEKKTEEKSVAAKEDSKRKFSMKLYSRARPRSIEEDITLNADSVKKE